MRDPTEPGRGGPTLPPAFTLHVFESVDSTNDEAKALARSGHPAFTLVSADSQRAGRGRRGRGWESPVGNLHASCVLRPGVGSGQAAQLSFVAALAIADTAARFLPAMADIRCKWPNDVLVNGRKVAGILLETETGPSGGVDWVVLGVGINLALAPSATETAATSLAAEGGEHADVAAALQVYAVELARWYERWRAEGFAAIRAAWARRAVGIGRHVVVRLADRVIEGVFTDLDTDGVLLLDRGDGRGIERIAAGDVFVPSAGVV